MVENFVVAFFVKERKHGLNSILFDESSSYVMLSYKKLYKTSLTNDFQWLIQVFFCDFLVKIN